MEISLNDIKIQLVKSVDSFNTSGDKSITSTLNCIFSKGFKNGAGSKESKNFYFYLVMGKGLVFDELVFDVHKGGMNWAPKELKDYMGVLEEMYSELVEQQGKVITVEEFLGYLVYKDRNRKLNDIGI
jgi:hypothetical protein